MALDLIAVLQVIADNKTYYHITEDVNVPAIMREGLKPQTGPRSIKMEDDDRVFLFTSEENYDNALSSWFGEEWEDIAEERGVDLEDINLTVLKVKLPSDFPLDDDHDDQGNEFFEASTKKIIPPKYISIHKENQ